MHHTGQILDTVIVYATGIITTATSLALTIATVTVPDSGQNELLLFLLPLLGATFTSGGCIMLNPNQETRKITIGRAIFALFFGMLLPQLIGILHPSLQAISIKPVFLFLAGGLISILGFIFSKPFAREMYARSDRLAKSQADRLEKKYLQDGNKSPREDAEGK